MLVHFLVGILGVVVQIETVQGSGADGRLRATCVRDYMRISAPPDPNAIKAYGCTAYSQCSASCGNGKRAITSLSFMHQHYTHRHTMANVWCDERYTCVHIGAVQSMGRLDSVDRL